MTEEGEKYKIILAPVSIMGNWKQLKQARGPESEKCEQKQT